MTYYFKVISATFGFILYEVLEPFSAVFSICITELILYYNPFIWDHPHL